MSALPLPFVSTPPRRLLIVDDDEAIRDLLSELLASLGTEIAQAASAGEAFASIAETTPDLILLDRNLPDGEGYAVIEQMRGTPRSRLVPIMVITGEASQGEKLRALREGASAFIGKPFDFEEIVTRVQALLRLKSVTDNLEDAQRVVVALARAIEARNPYTLGHSERVSEYAARLGEEAGLSVAELTALRVGSLFHDLGKVAVPDEVLLKPSRLTAQEYAEMRRHTVVGRELLEPLHTMRGVLSIVEHHHERLDGSGYPHGLRGDAIPLVVRVISIADVYDALTTPRPYRPARTSADTIGILREEARRGWWDSRLVELLAGFADTLPRPQSGVI